MVKIKKLIHKISGFGMLFSVLLVLLAAPLQPVSVSAQEAGGVVGFTECNFQEATPGGSNQIQQCLQTIFRFFFVIGLFVIVFRVAIVALENYNPFSNGQAPTHAIRLVWEVTIGLILIGGPAILVNTINPAALNLNFLNLGRLAASDNAGDSPGGVGAGGNTASTGGDPATGGSSDQTPTAGGRTAEETNQAIDTLQTQSSSYLPARLSQFAGLFAGISVSAQEEDIDPAAISDAEKVLKDVLTAEMRCQKPFVSEDFFDDCRALETDDFIQARRRIPTDYRELLTPLVESDRVITGPVVNVSPIQITPVNIPPVRSNVSGCSWYFAQVFAENDGRPFLVSSELCTLETPGVFWKIQDGKLVPNSGTTWESNSSVLKAGQVLYILTE